MKNNFVIYIYAILSIGACCLFLKVCFFTVKAAGAVDPSLVKGNIFIQIWGKNLAGKDLWVGCVLKPDPLGKWYIYGSNHKNVGCQKVTQDVSSITVTYPSMAKIVTSSIDADSRMILGGYSAGASVGTGLSIIQIYQNSTQ